MPLETQPLARTSEGDTAEIPLGIRTAAWDVANGFFINGQHLKLHGWGQKPTNEWPGLGAALPNWLQRALLIGFHSVVRGAVKQGELLRMNTATRAEAVWRCNALSGARMRATCLAQIDAPPPEQPDGQAPPNTAAERLAGIGG